jgi:hypothetical protein
MLKRRFLGLLDDYKKSRKVCTFLDNLLIIKT